MPTRSIVFFPSLLLLLVCLLPGTSFAGAWEYVFFKDTQYPLKVHFLEGELPGPTIMVQGGIQGDEPSGFITAQVLTGAKIQRGRLIILPRANVPSINLRRRQINVDMNRRFDQDYNRFYEDRVARVIRHLLAQSDVFIHLHEGSGFYYPNYVDAMRNPKRYGQSIIIDTLKWQDKLDLGQSVNTVLTRLNSEIPKRDFQFKLFNTKTFDSATSYPEMRKSLTCYALAEHNIPAMAVEVSKDISQIEWKVRHQLAATTMLMQEYGLEFTLPEISDDNLRAYEDHDVQVKLNGRDFADGQVIQLAPGETLEAVPERFGLAEFAPALALFASDRPGVNLLATRRMALEEFSDLELRSDGRRVARAKVHWTGPMPVSPKEGKVVFVCWLNGQPVFVRDGDVLKGVQGDQLVLEGIWGSPRGEIVNFKGFVAVPWNNDGQDLGWEIILDPDNFLDRYAKEGDRSGSLKYRVVRETKGRPTAEFYVQITPRKVHALRLADSRNQAILVPWLQGGSYRLPEGQYKLQEAWSNGEDNKLLTTVNGRPLLAGETFAVREGQPVNVTIRQATTFEKIGDMVFNPGNFAALK